MPTIISQPLLPPELILSIIECLALFEPIPIALPPTHPTTKTLLSLARTSSITYPTARRLLYSHCLWIDDPQRLLHLNASLRTLTNSTLSHCTRSHVPILQYMDSLYLSYPNIELRSLATNVLELFTTLAPYLRRLLVDMPFRNFDWTPTGAQITLRRAFEKLTALETFCCVRDELYLDTLPETPLRGRWKWPIWPRLKTLALYNQDISADGFWEDLGRMEVLETLVFTRSDGLEEVDMKAEWKTQWGNEKRGLEIVLVNVQSSHRVPRGRSGWKEDDVRVREVNVPISYYGDEDEIDLCQKFVKMLMLRGEGPTKWT